MARIPFMQLYPGDYIAKTMDLTTEQHGAYLLILMVMWQQDAKLPNDPAKLARIARMTPAKFRAVWDEISRFFIVEGEHISNPRLTKEWKKTSEKSSKRAVAGRAGGNAKALKDKEARIANAMPLPQHSSDTRDHIEEEPNGSLSSADDARPDVQPIDEISVAVSAYNATASSAGWPRINVLSKQRRSSLSARLKECGGIDGWLAALAKARASPLCNGHNDRGWVANFDFLTRQSSFAKLMEGNYDGRKSPQQNRPDPRSDALRDAIDAAGRMRRSSVPDFF